MPRATGRGRGGRGANRGAAASAVVNHRPLRDTAIKPKYLWCMCCLRTAVGEFNPVNLEKQAPFVIDCVLNAAGSVLCRQCFDRRSGCESYAETFFVDLEEGQENEDIVIFNEDVRRAINEAFKQLSSAFVQTVAVHRRYHGLTTNQKSRRVVDYEAFLARRRELPGVNYEKLYLMPGDTGYVLWTSAKRSFRTAVTEALNWQFEGDDLDNVLDDVLNGWPVIIGEL
ncbi:hypothetical protein BDQ94DRAFT_176508 [Aspergillus welwitschiae]|uniref:Uncharacterized protein n=1 Tax=Aspergillus welwitschiae TaxID=1341132 RepID=A0A3F3PHV2_9EURO|nr:hypothetical protein BDQ94DRAFT_176508 [Aspergillus welwitschiae]RDH26262.1 hypothetical protein BDQ94DRAFT_176508 [Aspergillus welwitschiae]